MERGKRICQTLKELRKRIADANGIPYEIEDCPHEGPCPGTCPRCEAEVRYLEKALDEKRERDEEVIIKGLMTDEELTLLVNNQNGIDIVTEPPHLMGIPALPPEDIKREKLEHEIFLAIIDCNRLAKSYPNVGLFISETDHDVLCVREPAREGEALFDYRIYDWRKLLEDGQPSEDAIGRLVEELMLGDIMLHGDVEEPIDDPETAWPDTPLEGDIIAPTPPNPPTRIKQVLTSITVAGTSHVKNIEELSEDIYEGVVLTMYLDVANRHDTHAIALYLGNQRIGYVPKAKNEILANLLTADISLIAVVTESEWRGNWLEIKADIALTDNSIINQLKDNIPH